MPHPTPTAAPEAPPLPLRGGRGSAPTMGAGGRPPSKKPRPGLEPGPRSTTVAPPTREVPGQARDGVAFTLAALLLALPAQAQVIPTGTPAADILLSQAISEQRVFHTCSAFITPEHDLVTSLWADEVAAATRILTENGVPPEAIAAFTTAAAAENLLPAPDTPFEDVRQLCAANPDWLAKLQTFAFTLLSQSLPPAFE